MYSSISGFSWKIDNVLGWYFFGGSYRACINPKKITIYQSVSFAPYICDNFLFMDDATVQRAQIVREYLNEVNIHRLVWLAGSRDLNVIEHIWDQLKRRIRRRNPASENLVELEIVEIAAFEERNYLQEFITNLFQGIQRRLIDVIRTKFKFFICLIFLQK